MLASATAIRHGPRRRVRERTSVRRGRSARGRVASTGYFLVAPEDLAELLDGHFELGGRLGVDVLLVLPGELQQLPDLVVEVGVGGQVLRLEVVGPDDLDLALDLLGVLFLDPDAAARTCCALRCRRLRGRRSVRPCGPRSGRDLGFVRVVDAARDVAVGARRGRRGEPAGQARHGTPSVVGVGTALRLWGALKCPSRRRACQTAGKSPRRIAARQRVSSAAMTERGLPGMDGAPACPFVAFGDDREARSTSPDHRHRCFAETPPAPRALAHQEAYCLSSAFPVCPTFQDWARREAAHARAAGEREPAPPPIGGDARTAPYDLYADWAVRATAASTIRGAGAPTRTTNPSTRNPPRDWAAPPPWATGAATAGALSSRSGVRWTPADDRVAGERLSVLPGASGRGPGSRRQSRRSARGRRGPGRASPGPPRQADTPRRPR